MRGLISAAGYVPYRRLDRSAIAGVFGGSKAAGTRSVASFDEDTTTLAVEAGRLALRSLPEATQLRPSMLWFATAEPVYLEKTNACAVHAALRLGDDVAAFDFGGAARSGIGALRAALDATVPVLVTAAGIRSGLPTSGDEAAGGDAGAAVLVGSETDGSLLATVLGGAAATAEYTDRWRVPGDRRTRQWEERFGEVQSVPLGQDAWDRALKDAGATAGDISCLIVTGPHARAVSRLRGKLAAATAASAPFDDLTATVGQSGAAHPLLLLAAALEQAQPGDVIALVSLVDGADVMLFHATDTVGEWQPTRTVETQMSAGGSVPYGAFLAWREMVTVQPPNRPAPDRASSAAAARNRDWKFALDRDDASLADATGRIVTFTIDRLAYSPSPPIVFAIVDFDSGDRLAVELTDVDADDVRIGDEVEMTFRRLSTADGIANYFWKARPRRSRQEGGG